MGKYRSRIEILAKMLRVASEGARKTHIMYKCNLSRKPLRQYLEDALSANLICCERDENLYATTKRGRLFLEKFTSYLSRLKKLNQETSEIDDEKRLIEDMIKRRELKEL